MAKHYHKNPRKITDKQLSQLSGWLEELGKYIVEEDEVSSE